MGNGINVTRSSLPDFDEYVDEIKDIWDTHWLTNMGAKHTLLCEELKKYLKVKYIELLTNGHMALEMAIQAFDFPADAEVITSPFTFASTTHAIVRNNLKPVFCDINESDYTIDVTKIESLITDKTVAIIPIHVYGNICDVKEIDKIAKKYGLKVIYDAAHAFGEEIDGISVASYGDASCFSFHATKVFNTIEGGAVVFKDVALGNRIYGLKNFGIRDEETVDGIGANAKMNEFCAAMGLCNLRHLDNEIAKRKAVFERYQMRLKGVDGIKICEEIADNFRCNYAYFPVVVDPYQFGRNRDEIKDTLEKYGIRARKYFYPITSEFDCYKNVIECRETPVALDISQKVLTLPLYADLSFDVVDHICDIVLNKS